jgi:formate/nitrite transporter FocA (FNT family)
VKSKQAKFERLSSAKRCAVLLCVLLAGIAIVAQAFHLHSNDLANDAKHCTICQVAHAPVQAATVATVALGLPIAAFFVFSNHPDPKPVLASFSLFCRPPPLV